MLSFALASAITSTCLPMAADANSMMDAVFGIAGVIAAPIYYVYLKIELKAQDLI